MSFESQLDTTNKPTDIVLSQKCVFDEEEEDCVLGATLILNNSINTDEMVVRTDGTHRTQWKQWAAGITATLAMVCNGTIYGWMTTSLTSLLAEDSPIIITSDQIPWILSLTGVGCIMGSFISVASSDTFGRKKTQLFAAFIYISGWIFVISSTQAEHLYVARMIQGMGMGISHTVVPLYVSEIADINIRGALSTLIALNAFTGLVFVCSVGPFVSAKSLPIIMLMIPIIFLCLFVWFPESPYHLASKKKNDDALKALMFFKGISDHQEARAELELVMLNIKQGSDSQSWGNKFRDMLLPNNKKALLISACLTITTMMSGNYTTMVYLEVLFQKANIGIDTNLATVIVLIMGLFSCGLSTVTIEKLGRRPLLLFSTLGTSLILTVFASYLMAEEKGVDMTSINWLPIVVIVLFQLAFQVGLQSVPHVLISEIFPTNVRSIGGAVQTIIEGVARVIVSKFYQVIGDAVNEYVMFYIYSASCFLGFLFILAFIPETKNKRFDEIQEELENNTLQCFKKPNCSLKTSTVQITVTVQASKQETRSKDLIMYSKILDKIY